MSNVSLYIQYGRIAQYESAAKNRKNSVFKGGVIVPDYSHLLYILQTQINKRFVLLPSDPTLTATSEYMFSLSGIRTINTTPIATPFIIVLQPNDANVNVGLSVTFNVAASGGTLPYQYQWQKNGVNIGGATSPSLTINPVSLSDAGGFDCVVTDNLGQILTSRVANLVVNAAALTGSFYYGATDYFAALSAGTDAISYPGTFPITHNQPLTVPYPIIANNNMFLVIRVPIGETIKTTWFNTVLNSGFVPDSVFRTVLQPVGLPLYSYYLTRVSVSNDFSSPLILT